MVTMRVNGLLRKNQLLSKTGTAYDEYEGKFAPQEKWHAPVSRSRVTLPWHAPVARSRGTLPPRAPAGTTCHQARNPSGKHIYQRATVKDLKINLLGKHPSTSNVMGRHPKQRKYKAL